MTIDEHNIIVERAKTRKDGVYAYKNNLFVVLNNNFVAFADPYGNCYEQMGIFNVVIGKVKSYERKEMLKKWLQAKKSK